VHTEYGECALQCRGHSIGWKPAKDKRYHKHNEFQVGIDDGRLFIEGPSSCHGGHCARFWHVSAKEEKAWRAEQKKQMKESGGADCIVM